MHLYYGTPSENIQDSKDNGTYISIWDKRVLKYGYEEACKRNARFGNNNGLVSEGGNLFTRGPSSGAAEIGAAQTGKRGGLLSKNLESSNVELTSEFTNLIATQRAYQANARTITTSDSILQELVSLVR